MSDSTSRSSALDAVDRQIIAATEAGLPLTTRPYHTLAEQLGLDVEDVMARLQRMQSNGMIRRIAAVPNHYKIGYRLNGMTVWDVDDAQITELGAAVGNLPFVSHCYRRPRHLPTWPYNLFAMVHGREQAEVDAHIAEIRQVLGAHCRGSEVLFSKRILKKTGFRSVRAY